MPEQVTKLCVWPDYTYCELRNIEEYTNYSDNYRIVGVPDSVPPEEREQYLRNWKLQG